MGYMAQDKGMGTALRKQRVYGKSQREKRAIHGNIPLSSFVRRAAQGQKGFASSYVAQRSPRQTVQQRLPCCPPPPVGCMWFPRLGCVLAPPTAHCATLFKQRKSFGLINKRKSMAHALCTMH